MNFRMTVQTRAGKHPVCVGIPLKSVLAGVDVSGMSGCVMTALSQLGCASDEEFPMITPMDGMACPAIFCDRGMLLKKRTAFLSVTFEAKLIHRTGFDHPRAESAVLVMTIGTLHFPFAQGMV